MNIEEEVEIKRILKDRPDLICELLWKKSFEEARKILEIPEWKDEKYQGLLTPTIWQNSSKSIKKNKFKILGKSKIYSFISINYN